MQNDDLNLSSLESHDDSEIVYMTKIIEDQKANLVSFKADIALPDISLAFHLRHSNYDKLESLLLQSCNIQPEPLILDENQEVRDFSLVLDKTQGFWLCKECSRVMRNDCVFCEQCQVFKPLEMYKNLMFKPMEATPEEIQSLDQRRKEEKQLIIERDIDRVDEF